MDATVAQPGLLDTAAKKLGLDGFMQKLNISKPMLIEIGLYLGLGFVVGFLLKRFSKLFLVLVLTLLFLWFLQHMGIMLFVVNWQRVQELVLGQPSLSIMSSQPDLGSMAWNWVTTHVAAVISFSVGFFAGIRLG